MKEAGRRLLKKAWIINVYVNLISHTEIEFYTSAHTFVKVK